MVTSGTGHDRCPSLVPGPVRRPGATLRWRLKNKKSSFWFQGPTKNFRKEVVFVQVAGPCMRRSGLVSGNDNPRNKCFRTTFDASEPSPAVHNGACRG